MTTLKRQNRTKCECGKKVAEGSVFCISCRAAVIQKNLKLLSGDRLYFAKKS